MEEAEEEEEEEAVSHPYVLIGCPFCLGVCVSFLLKAMGRNMTVTYNTYNVNNAGFALRYFAGYAGAACPFLNLTTPWGWVEPIAGNQLGMLTPGERCVWRVTRPETLALYVTNVSLPVGATLQILQNGTTVLYSAASGSPVSFGPVYSTMSEVTIQLDTTALTEISAGSFRIEWQGGLCASRSLATVERGLITDGAAASQASSYVTCAWTVRGASVFILILPFADFCCCLLLGGGRLPRT